MPLAAAALALALAAPAGDTIRLTFRWPEGLRCQVERKTRTSMRGRDAEESLRYDLELRRAGAGWLVQRTFVEATGDRRRRDPQALADHLLPSFRVRRDGRFVGLALEAATRARLRAEEQRWRSLTPPEFAKPTAYRFSEANLTRMASDEWNDLVAWTGATLSPGEARTEDREVETEVPPLGRLRLPRKETFRMSGRVPCQEGGPPACVELQAEFELDAERYTRALEKGMAGLPGADRGSMKVTRMKSRRTLVTDPATLIPRTSIRVTESGMQVDGDPGVFTAERIETFRCTP